MPLESDHLRRAIDALEAALERVNDDHVIGSLDEVSQNLMRMGMLRYFVNAYEICRVLIDRWLRENFGRDVASVSRREIYRIAGETGLIDGVERWFVYHQERNRSSHRYDAEMLKMLSDTVPKFVEDANALFAGLSRQDA